MRFITHAHAREKLLAGAARFPCTAGGRSIMREAYEFSFMPHPAEATRVSDVDWDAVAGQINDILEGRGRSNG
ncbi:hypothetical protein BRY73_23930 [Ochrobactrum sp. P6BS-III]|uniref:hypothetical protein n=1 Tax=unclassified Ochrobactrum TaxID=239106 RepID=UPI0009CF5CDB|nr:FPC/CPF motif-containing protein YcgG [Ochrobactrum sp. P6BSIII]OOL14276.1 hypothetical protein BRY73_23930 [Ochrobactrum sp. P6BS-III]